MIDSPSGVNPIARTDFLWIFIDFSLNIDRSFSSSLIWILRESRRRRSTSTVFIRVNKPMQMTGDRSGKEQIRLGRMKLRRHDLRGKLYLRSIVKHGWRRHQIFNRREKKWRTHTSLCRLSAHEWERWGVEEMSLVIGWMKRVCFKARVFLSFLSSWSSLEEKIWPKQTTDNERTNEREDIGNMNIKARINANSKMK